VSDSTQCAGDAGFGDLVQKYQRYAERQAASAVKTKANLMAALKAAGVARVTVVFDGEGDSGGVEDVQVEGADTLPSVQVTCFAAGYGDDDPETATENPLRQAVEDLAMTVLSAKHGGWENNDGGYGEVVFDVAAECVTLDYNERFTDTTNYTHEL
jgi:hypothetical protein